MITCIEQIEEKYRLGEPLSDKEIDDYISFQEEFLKMVEKAGRSYKCLTMNIIMNLCNFKNIRNARLFY